MSGGVAAPERPAEAAPAGVTGDGTSTRSRALARWRRWRLAAAVGVLVLAGAVLTVVVTGSPGAGTLDPDSAGPDGGRAVAQVLRREGVDVQRVTRVDAALGAAGPGSTVLVVDAPVLAPDRLRRLAATGADLVVVAPDGAALDALGVDLAPAGTVAATVTDAACEDADARAAGRATGGGALLRATGPGATVCFPEPGADGGAAADGEGANGAFAVASLPDGGGTLRVIGQRDVLRNASVLTAGNAALSLRVLGSEPTLVWLLASPLDAATEQPSPLSLLPGWVGPLAAQLAVVALLAALWRGRRLGRLVPEPLPVVVRSAETAQGRAALYRQAGAHRPGRRRAARGLDDPARPTSGAAAGLGRGRRGRRRGGRRRRSPGDVAACSPPVTHRPVTHRPPLGPSRRRRRAGRSPPGPSCAWRTTSTPSRPPSRGRRRGPDRTRPTTAPT